MSLDILDLTYRMECRFGIKLRREEIVGMVRKNEPPDVTVGELFEFVRRKAILAGTLDEEMDDPDSVWMMFRQIVSDALGLDLDDITKDRWMIHQLFWM